MDERVVDRRLGWGNVRKLAAWSGSSRLAWITALLGAALVAFVIAASVLSNQPLDELTAAGRACHVLSMACAIALIFLRNSVGGVLLFAILAGTYALGPAARGAYECLLLALMFGAGAAVQRFHPGPARTAVVWITIASGCVMFLQVVGISEWTQILTTHGKIGDSEWLTKAPAPTLFMPLQEVEANVLQGRPAGLLHSNQFAALVILFALALYSSSSNRRNFFVEVMLCATAVLSLSKVVFLGLAGLILYQAIFGGREGRLLAGRGLALTGAILLAYALLFPGLVQGYFLSWPLLWQSIAVRVSQFGVASGVSEGSIISYLLDEELNMGLYESGAISKAQLFVIADAAQLSTASVAAMVVGNARWLYALAGSVLILCVANANTRRVAVEVASQVNYPVLIVLSAFCLSANFLDAPVFWLMAGFAFPMIWGKARVEASSASALPNPTDRTVPAVSHKDAGGQIHEGGK